MLYKYNKQTLQFERIGMKNYIYSVIFAIFIFSSLSAGVATKLVIEKIPVIYKESTPEFSEKLLKQELEQIKMPFKDIVYAQIILETGHFTSPVFKQNNNLTGMKLSYTRSNFQNGENLGFAVYKDWKLSVYDYCLYINKYCNNMSEEEFIQFLDEYYCPNQQYKEKIKQLRTKL